MKLSVPSPLMGAVLVGLLCGLVAPRLAAPAKPPAASSSPAVEELIKLLAHPNFKIRKAATKTLLSREDAIPALRQALHSTDKEVVRRAREILDHFARREVRRAVAKLMALAKRGAADQLAEQLVQRRDWAGEDDAAWQAVIALANRVVEIEKREVRKAKVVLLEQSSFDFGRYRKEREPTQVASSLAVVRGKGAYMIRAREVRVQRYAGHSLIVSTGKVRVGVRISYSAVLAGDSVEARGVSRSVIICDGSFHADEHIDDSIIIARGPVTCAGQVTNSLIVSGSTVSCTGVSRPENHNSVVKQRQSKPLGFIAFFEVRQAGLEVTATKRGVKVKLLPGRNRFGCAGLLSGDVVVAINGADVTSPEGFRRSLRQALATDKPMLLKILREGKPFQVRIPCKD